MSDQNKVLMDRVTAKLKQCIALAEAHFKTTIPMPNLSYGLRGTTAGTADYKRWTININGALFLRNVEETIENTVPHELGHLLKEKFYPEGFKGFTRTRSGRLRREKRDVHGEDWKRCCQIIGMTPEMITRCHEMETDDLRRITARSRTIEHKCMKCSKVLVLSPKMTAALETSPYSRWHCKGYKLVRIAGSSPAPVVTPPKVSTPDVHWFDTKPTYSTPAPSRTASPVNVGGTYATKMDHCRALFNANKGVSRQAMIALFVAHAKCTPAGAATYYATLNK